MGFNTSVLILNDCLSDIEADPEFSKKLCAAICGLRTGQSDNFTSGATAVETHHADGYSVVAFGGNRAIDLGTFYPYGDEEFSVRLLRELARSMGYSLRKKR